MSKKRFRNTNQQQQQQQLDTIPTLYYIGGFFSFLAGIANDKYGPQIVTFFGGIVTSVSILAEWAIAKDTVPGVTIDDHNVVWLLSIANFIWALGNAMMTAPAFSTAIRNFPSARGGGRFRKGAVGIIGGLFTQLWAGYMFVPDKGIHTVDYLLAVAVYIFVVAMCALPFIKVYEATPSQSTRKRRIQYSYVNLFLLCVVVGIAAAMESSNSSSARRGFAIGITFLVCTLFGVFLIQSDDTQTITTIDDDDDDVNKNKSVQNEGKKLGDNFAIDHHSNERMLVYTSLRDGTIWMWNDDYIEFGSNGDSEKYVHRNKINGSLDLFVHTSTFQDGLWCWCRCCSSQHATAYSCMRRER